MAVLSPAATMPKNFVKMGAPYFQIKDDLRRHGIQAFSSNYALYGEYEPASHGPD